MKLMKNVTLIAVVTTIAALSSANSAQAFSFKETAGVNGPNGVTDQGAFSKFAGKKGFTTIDFNDGKAPTTGFAKFSFENGQRSSVRSDRWSPSGAKGEVNTSKYLAVFNGDKVTINLATTLNYFGIDWGAISANNTFSFYKGDQLIKSYTTADVDSGAPVKAQQHGGQGNAVLDFFADNSKELFNKIVISQSSTNGGGFESDNFTFHAGKDAFDFKKGQTVPEPGMMIGLMAVGSAALLKRKNQKSA